MERGHAEPWEGRGQVTVGSIAAARRSKPRARGLHSQKWPWRSTCGAASARARRGPIKTGWKQVAVRREPTSSVWRLARASEPCYRCTFSRTPRLKCIDVLVLKEVSKKKNTHPSIPKTPPCVPCRDRTSEKRIYRNHLPKERLEAPALHERRAHKKAACKDTRLRPEHETEQ